MLGGRSCAVLLAVVLLEVVVLAVVLGCSVSLLPLLGLSCPSLAASALARSASMRAAQKVQMCMVSSVFVLFCVVGSCTRRDVRGERDEAGAGVRKVDS
jgi:hypothetical protein